MNPLGMAFIFRRQSDSDSDGDSTVYYKTRLTDESGDTAFESKGVIRFRQGQSEVKKSFVPFTVPQSGKYTLYAQFRDDEGKTFDSEAVADLKRNLWILDPRILVIGLALAAVGAGLLITERTNKDE